MLYRSWITRWFLACTAVTAGLIFALGDGDKWRSTTSFHWLAQAPIPLQLWGLCFVAYGLLLLPVTTRPAAFAAGGVLFAIFTVSLLATLDLAAPDPKNVIVIAAMLQTTAFNAFSVRTAWAVKLAA